MFKEWGKGTGNLHQAQKGSLQDIFKMFKPHDLIKLYTNQYNLSNFLQIKSVLHFSVRKATLQRPSGHSALHSAAMLLLLLPTCENRREGCALVIFVPLGTLSMTLVPTPHYLSGELARPFLKNNIYFIYISIFHCFCFLHFQVSLLF